MSINGGYLTCENAEPFLTCGYQSFCAIKSIFSSRPNFKSARPLICSYLLPSKTFPCFQIMLFMFIHKEICFIYSRFACRNIKCNYGNTYQLEYTWESFLAVHNAKHGLISQCLQWVGRIVLDIAWKQNRNSLEGPRLNDLIAIVQFGNDLPLTTSELGSGPAAVLTASCVHRAA
jgi:hypothetical protein